MVGPNANPYSAYSRASHTVAKTRQIVMLYDGAIRFIQQAKEAINEKRIEDRFNLLVKASKIVLGLQSCLDFDGGGEAARALYDFYSQVDARMTALHRTNNMDECDALVAELKDMRELWNGIDCNEINDASAATQGVVSEQGLSAPSGQDTQDDTLEALELAASVMSDVNAAPSKVTVSA